jgi:hypothetical protein
VLGRGNNKFVFTQSKVIKLTASEHEAKFMQTHTKVCVPVHSIDPLTMERWYDIDQYKPRVPLTYGVDLLHKHLWTINASPCHWHDALHQHMHGIFGKYTFKFPFWSLEDVIHDLHREVKAPYCLIHGDATAANLVHAPLVMRRDFRYRWIDPLNRSYIPGDPHVDLGKMFQSCWGYERILLGDDKDIKFNEQLARDLCKHVNLSFDLAWKWHIIHLFRLLPYQDSRVSLIFQEILNDILV